MQILYCRLCDEPQRERTRCVATVDVEFDHNLRLYGLRLLQMADGQFRVFAPQSGQRRVASFSTDMAKRLTAMALRAWQDMTTDGASANG